MFTFPPNIFAQLSFLPPPTASTNCLPPPDPMALPSCHLPPPGPEEGKLHLPEEAPGGQGQGKDSVTGVLGLSWRAAGAGAELLGVDILRFCKFLFVFFLFLYYSLLL